MDLEVARADRRLDAVAVAAGLLEDARDRRLAGPEEAEHAPARRLVAPAPAARGSVEGAWPEPLQLARRPGQDHDGARPAWHDEPRRRARQADRLAPAGSVACLVTPTAKSAYGRRGARPPCARCLRSPSRAPDRRRARRRRCARASPPCGRRASVRDRPRRRRDPLRGRASTRLRARTDRLRRSRSSTA